MEEIQKIVEDITVTENEIALKESSQFILSLDKFLKDFGKTLNNYNSMPKIGAVRDEQIAKGYDLFLKQLTQAFYWVEKIRERITKEEIKFHLGYVDNNSNMQLYETTYTLEEAIEAGILSPGRMSSKKGAALKLMGNAKALIKNAGKTQIRDPQRLACYNFLLANNGNVELGLPKLNQGQLFEAYIIATSKITTYQSNLKDIFIQAKNKVPFFAGADIEGEENFSVKFGPMFSVANSHTLYRLLAYIKTILTNPKISQHSKEFFNLLFKNKQAQTYHQIFKTLNARMDEVVAGSVEELIEEIKQVLLTRR